MIRLHSSVFPYMTIEVAFFHKFFGTNCAFKGSCIVVILDMNLNVRQIS